MKEKYGDINVKSLDGFVAECEIDRPPNNFFDLSLIRDMACLLYTSPSPRDLSTSRMPSSA